MKCICQRCNREFDYARSKGGTKSKCNTCHVTEHRRKNKRLLVEHFGGCCIRCGYNKSFAALSFHHRDPSEKNFTIAANTHHIALAKLIAEAEKCDLLCLNCHAEVEEELDKR